MKKIQALSKEISVLTLKIELEFPELYKLLDENPITIPHEQYPLINSAVLSEYLKSLKQLLQHKMKEQKAKKGE